MKATRPFSTFEWILALRYLRPRRKEAFISVIAVFSFLGIMLGVATLVVVMAVMNGFPPSFWTRSSASTATSSCQPIESDLTDYDRGGEAICGGAGGADRDPDDRGPGARLGLQPRRLRRAGARHPWSRSPSAWKRSPVPWRTAAA